MNTVDEAVLREATQLLNSIDDDPMHPANDARHPNHQACVRACQKLEQWRDEQSELLAKQKLADSYMERH